MSVIRLTEPHRHDHSINLLPRLHPEQRSSIGFLLALSSYETRKMYQNQRQDVNTATLGQSIWQPLSQKKFLQNVVDLHQISKKVPGNPKIHSRTEWSAERIRYDSVDYILPFSVEQRLADDLAFIAAAEEGVKAISAVGLEQNVETHSLIVRLAANDTIPQDLPATFESMFDLLGKCALQSVFKILALAGRKLTR